MAGLTATLLIAGTVAAVAGAGISAYGQYQQGQTQNAIAQFNAAQQEKQAQSQMLAMRTQSALQKQQAEQNFALRSAEAQARLRNARSIERTALNQDKVNRENLRKRREQFSRMQGESRAQIAASGVAESTGTPLDILADTAAKIQQDQEEQHYIGEVQRRTLFSEAARERLGGKLALVGATLDRNSGLAEAALRDAASRGEYVAGMREAQISRLTGSTAAKNANLSAGATLLSGLSGAASSAYQFRTS
jgi:hypothetical protein